MVEFGTSFSEASLLRVLAISFRAVLWKIRFTLQSKFHLGNFSTPVSPTNWNSEPILSDLGLFFLIDFCVEKRRKNTTKNTGGDDKILKSSDRVVPQHSYCNYLVQMNRGIWLTWVKLSFGCILWEVEVNGLTGGKMWLEKSEENNFRCLEKMIVDMQLKVGGEMRRHRASSPGLFWPKNLIQPDNPSPRYSRVFGSFDLAQPRGVSVRKNTLWNLMGWGDGAVGLAFCFFWTSCPVGSCGQWVGFTHQHIDVYRYIYDIFLNI